MRRTRIHGMAHAGRMSTPHYVLLVGAEAAGFGPSFLWPTISATATTSFGTPGAAFPRTLFL